jgi:hypothetical protein
MVGNKSGKRISNCTPTIGQCQQHHAAIGGKSATIEGSSDFLARNGWQVEAESIIVGHGGCGSEARRAQVVLTPIPYASSTLCATPVSSISRPAE